MKKINNTRKLPLPNYFQCPNLVIDELMPTLSTGAFKQYLFLIRHTVGMLNRESTKGISQERVIAGTGMSRTSVYRASKELKELGLIEVLGTKKSGYEYVVFFEVSAHNYNFKTFLMFQIETYKKHGLMFQNETSYVSNWNILYILNTYLKDNNKKYIKKNPLKSASKKKKSVKQTKSKTDFTTVEVFINYDDFKKMVMHLEELNGSLTATRITKNLNKLKFNKGRSFAFDAEAFKRAVDKFITQTDYLGIWVEDVKRDKKQKEKTNGVDDLKQESKNEISVDELNEELASYGIIA
ncbi:hypothetical protein MNB_SV-14-1032 [hydrothermal vent metagenome]|uniref:Uncharacterized protein n=1 Tax=hydrothermal vent metagenome TaxID=652676 RepID=A0A1W1CCV8_9ZZZZ